MWGYVDGAIWIVYSLVFLCLGVHGLVLPRNPYSSLAGLILIAIGTPLFIVQLGALKVQDTRRFHLIAIFQSVLSGILIFGVVSNILEAYTKQTPIQFGGVVALAIMGLFAGHACLAAVANFRRRSRH